MSIKTGASLACYALAIGLALYFWSPLVNAKWGLIDDHEIMFFIGTPERMPLSNLQSIVRDTELSSNSTAPRFRPSYYAFRAIESAIWGKNATLWYLFRIAVAMLLGVTLARLCLRFAGPILTAGFLVFALSAPYWADIFARAGPGETYAVLGVCLVGLGLGANARSELSGLRAFTISLGIVIAAGSKENFLILGLLPLWLLFGKQPRPTRAGKLLLLGVLGFLGWIALTLFSRLRQAGTDIYANDVSIVSRFKLLESFFSIPVVKYWLAGLLLLALVGILLKLVARKNSASPAVSATASMNTYIILGCGLFALYAAQFIFYNGNWPGNANRYQFPGILALHFSILVGLVALVCIVKLVKPGKHVVAFIEAALALCFVIGSAGMIKDNRNASLETIRMTTAFDERFRIVVDYLRRNPAQPLILNTFNVIDYEPIYSIERFIRASGLSNPLAIRMSGYSPDQFPANSHEGILSGALDRVSQRGSDNMFVPLSSISQTDCFSVGMSGPFLKTCNGGGIDIWP